MEEKKSFQNRDGARVVGGLILVAAGVALFMRNMEYVDLPYWLFTWPMILILIGIYSGVKHNFQNNGWIILMGIGFFFLVDRFIPNLKLEPAFWPIVIICFGILFIIRPRRKYRDRWNIDNDRKEIADSSWKPSDKTSTDKSDYLKVDSVFSGVNKTVLSKNFQGGKISSVFGGAEIDLSQADISGNIVLKLDVVFGGVKLIIPAHWTIHNEIEGVFHSVDDKRRYNGTATDPSKMLILKGSAVFGGVEVKSY